MASSVNASSDLGVSEHHEQIIRQYMRFSRQQKSIGLRSIRAAAEDVKTQRLQNEAALTTSEVDDILNDLIEVLAGEFDQEITHQYRINTLLIKQLFEQSEQWYLKLKPNFDQLENRQLLDKIKQYEEQVVKGNKQNKDSGDRSYSVKIDQINDTQTTILLKTEIQKLQQLNDQMKKKIQQYEKDLNIKDSTYEMSLNDQLLEKANLKLEKEQVSKEKQSYEKEMQSSQTRLVELQKQLEMTEHELDKKFNQTNTYKNMKSMLESKNETIKQLRRQLGEGNSGDYGSQEEDD